MINKQEYNRQCEEFYSRYPDEMPKKMKKIKANINNYDLRENEESEEADLSQKEAYY